MISIINDMTFFYYYYYYPLFFFFFSNQIRQVDTFVNSVNTALRHKQEFERLSFVTSKIDAYDVIVSCMINDNNSF